MTKLLEATLASRWPIHKNRYIFADRMYEDSLKDPCRGICAHCGEIFDGTFLTEKEWFRTHKCGGK